MVSYKIVHWLNCHTIENSILWSQKHKDQNGNHWDISRAVQRAAGAPVAGLCRPLATADSSVRNSEAFLFQGRLLPCLFIPLWVSQPRMTRHVLRKSSVSSHSHPAQPVLWLISSHWLKRERVWWLTQDTIQVSYDRDTSVRRAKVWIFCWKRKLGTSWCWPEELFFQKVCFEVPTATFRGSQLVWMHLK